LAIEQFDNLHEASVLVVHRPDDDNIHRPRSALAVPTRPDSPIAGGKTGFSSCSGLTGQRGPVPPLRLHPKVPMVVVSSHVVIVELQSASSPDHLFGLS
jgi:hypothetical protein